ncbi:hypothetical protein [Glaciihabitans sp. UYNi722]|uniref:hypothetical protein n=1 Tax=Glaciihabitans sp. UYNi722 TaxID=3156344 RepID=UPI003391AD8E
MSLPQRPRLFTHARSNSRSLVFAPRTGFLRRRLTTVVATLTTAFLAVGLVAVGVAAPASAADAAPTNNTIVSAAVSCSPDYHWTVTWTVQNASTSPATITVSSDEKLIPINTGLRPNETKTFAETVTGPVDKTLTLDATRPYWSPSHDSGSVTTAQFTGTCATPPPPTTCIPDSAISYTYSTVTNNGTITVAKPANSTGVLCQPLYVTASSWKYTQNSVWPQSLDQVQKLTITAAGTYPYAAALSCGQGDIYASRTGIVEPTSTLSGPQGWEKFLSGFGFTTMTTGNSYVQQPADCFGLVIPVAPTVTAVATCGMYGQVVAMPATGVIYAVDFDSKTGLYTVTATPAPGYHFQGNYPSKTFSGKTGTYTECPPEVIPATPTASLAAICGASDISVSNAFTPAEHTIGQDVTAEVFIDGQLKDSFLVKSSDIVSRSYTFTVGGGHLVEVKVNGEVIGSKTVQSDCAIVTAADPSGQACVDNQLTDGQIFVALNDHLVYKIDGTVVASANTDVTTGSHHVTAELAEPNAGYTLDGQTTWTFNVADHSEACGDLQPHPLVTPTLSSSQQSCSNAGSYTLDDVEGVVWTVNGNVVPAGTYSVTSAKTVDVLASTVSSDYGFGQDTQTAWPLDFAAANNCGQLNTLAFTGAGGETGGLLVAGLLFLLAGAGVYTFGRVRKAHAE